MTIPQKIYLDMVGCRLNQSELESIGSQVRRAGHKLVGKFSEADIAIINTCAVTMKAASDSRQLARRIGSSGVKQVILTGCWASLEPHQAASLPGVTQVIPNTHKDQLVALAIQPSSTQSEVETARRQPLPGARKRTRAFIKVQDGCNKRCTFCITTVARGSSTSVAIDDILAAVRAAESGGVKEVILTGVQLGSWGSDFGDGSELGVLLQVLLHQTGIQRIRLSSIEPWGITPFLLSMWENPRICRQLHIPLQSGSATTLRRMARNITPDRFSSLVSEIRQSIPDAAITTDIIVGFPGERELDFEDSLQFVRAMQFAGGHVFTYSERPGTAAASFPGQVQHSVRRQRSIRMRAVLNASAYEIRSRFIGRQLTVLWDSLVHSDVRSWTLKGYSSEGICVRAQGSSKDLNQIHKVRIQSNLGDGFVSGEILRNHSRA